MLAEGSFRELHLAEHDGAGGLEPLHDGGIFVGLPVREYFRTAGRGNPAGTQQVLQRDRRALQRTRCFAARHRGIEAVGTLKSPVTQNKDVRTEFGIEAFNTFEHRLDNPHGRQRATLDTPGHVRKGETVNVHCRPPW